MSEVVEPAMRDTLSAVWGWRNVVRRTWFSELGSGKVAGKVLIVDQYAEHAKVLILLETVLKWCCV
jgi:hypothetical protein